MNGLATARTYTYNNLLDNNIKEECLATGRIMNNIGHDKYI